MKQALQVIGIAELENAHIKCKGYGSLGWDNKKQVSEDSIFHLCSISKFITAIVVMKLCQDNVLTLDEPVNHYLTDWKLQQSDGREASRVTLRHLLLHSSGIVDAEDRFYGYRRTMKYPSLLDLLDGVTSYNDKKVQTEYAAEEQFEYSDGGFCVIQKVIETVTNEKFNEVTDKYIFAPLKLKNTFFATPENMLIYQNSKELVTGYDENGNPMEDRYVICPDMAAAGLWCSPKELLMIVQDLFDSMDGQGKILEKSYADELMKYQSNQFSWVGLGHFFEGPDSIVSKGWGEDAQSMLWIDCINRRAITVAGNWNPGKPQEETQIGQLVLEFKESFY